IRMKLPGTEPPNVQNRYSTPSESFRTTSFTSRVTITFVEWERLIGGGTFGACASTAISSPTIVGSELLTLGLAVSLAAANENVVAANNNALASVACRNGEKELILMSYEYQLRV